MTNKEEIFELIRGHPEGLDDDDIARLTGICRGNRFSSFVISWRIKNGSGGIPSARKESAARFIISDCGKAASK
jgi:hypothetical protein